MEEEVEKNMEELSLVQSAVSEPHRTLHMCDNKCREKGSKFFEIAAESEEAGELHAIKLHSGGQKASRGKLWAACGLEQFMRRMWERFTFKNAWARPVLAAAENVR